MLFKIDIKLFDYFISKVKFSNKLNKRFLNRVNSITIYNLTNIFYLNLTNLLNHRISKSLIII